MLTGVDIGTKAPSRLPVSGAQPAWHAPPCCCGCSLRGRASSEMPWRTVTDGGAAGPQGAGEEHKTCETVGPRVGAAAGRADGPGHRPDGEQDTQRGPGERPHLVARREALRGTSLHLAEVGGLAVLVNTCRERVRSTSGFDSETCSGSKRSTRQAPRSSTFPERRRPRVRTGRRRRRRVCRFGLFYDRDSPHGARKATIRSWTDITDTRQTEPLRHEIAQAFIWAPPPRRTDLTPRPVGAPLTSYADGECRDRPAP